MRFMSPMIASALMTASVICSSPAVSATTMLRLDTPALAARADRIVLAKVESQTSRWSAAHTYIFTEVTLRVEKVYKGKVTIGDAITVRREGGVAEGVGQRVSGAAAFQSGEEVMAFVEKRGGADYIAGMAQGKLHVDKAADGTRTVKADVSQIAFINDNSQAQAAPHYGAMKLEDMEAAILKTVKAGGK